MLTLLRYLASFVARFDASEIIGTMIGLVVPIGVIVAALSFAPACTPADRAVAGNVIADVAAVAGSAVPCAIITGISSKVPATACGAVSTDVSDVAKLVSSILASLPPAQRAAEADPVVAFTVRGVTVTLPQSAARAVQERLSKDGGV